MLILDDGSVVALPEFTSSFDSLTSVVKDLVSCLYRTQESAADIEVKTEAAVSSTLGIESPLSDTQCTAQTQRLQCSDSSQDSSSDSHEKEIVSNLENDKDLPVQMPSESEDSKNEIEETNYILFKRLTKISSDKKFRFNLEFVLIFTIIYFQSIN